MTGNLLPLRHEVGEREMHPLYVNDIIPNCWRKSLIKIRKSDFISPQMTRKVRKLTFYKLGRHIMRNIISIIFIAATMLVACCHKPAKVHTQSAPAATPATAIPVVPAPAPPKPVAAAPVPAATPAATPTAVTPASATPAVEAPTAAAPAAATPAPAAAPTPAAPTPAAPADALSENVKLGDLAGVFLVALTVLAVKRR